MRPLFVCCLPVCLISELRRLLFNNQLSGTLPLSVGQLTALTILYDAVEVVFRYPHGLDRHRSFYNNLLVGTIPTQIGQLVALNTTLCDHKGLRVLMRSTLFDPRRQLANNQFSGTIPSSVFLLTALRELCAESGPVLSFRAY